MYLGSSTTDLPLDILDAHLLTSLVVIVVPFAFCKIDGGKRRVGLNAGSLEITLDIKVSSEHNCSTVRFGEPTSALKSTNSRPRQSMVRMFCAFAGSC